MINLEQLNPEQRTAVTTDEQYVLVLAGAGSGKTKVLTTRMAWLMEQGLVSPGGILAVTFTNKAAKEMLMRVSSLLPINTQAMWVGTFHGLSNRLLRTHYRDVGLPQGFQILDMQDQLSMIKRLLKQYNVDTEQYPPKSIQQFINAQKEQGLRPHDIKPIDDFENKGVELYAYYQQQCDKEGVVDFAELLLRAVELLKNNEPIRTHYQRRFAYILVDEFQDTNQLQYQWLRLLAGSQGSVFAVGDDDQSIYTFRGADIGNMRDYQKDYAKDNIIRLEQNYRSYNHILGAANALISLNTERLGKVLWTDRGEGELIRINELPSSGEEAQWIVDETRSLLREGVDPQELAILYRNNAQSRALENALFSSGIPYRVYGGLRFFERQEIKHVLAYLRLIFNADDDTSFLRVVNFPARGIGARTLENLSDAAQQIGCSLNMAVGAIKGAAATKLQGFTDIIQRLRLAANEMVLPDLILQVLHETGIENYYRHERDGEDRLENLQELINAAKVFCTVESFEDCPAMKIVTVNAVDEHAYAFVEETSALERFLSHASLEAGNNQAKDNERAIQLMTVHAAKGLEFDAVFICGLEQGTFPSERSIEAGLEAVEEERRLMYVAITRAKKRLYLSGGHERLIYGQTRYTTRSQFLEELPDEHIKWLSPRIRETKWGEQHYNFSHDGSGAYASTRQASNTKSLKFSTGVEINGQLFSVGTRVRHARFGEGIVMNLIGQGIDTQALIVFEGAGAKTLALGIAKVEVL